MNEAEELSDVAVDEVPADKAARGGLWLAIASFASLGLSVWLAQFVGVIACNVGTFVWLGLWTGGVGLAYAAIKNGWSSRTPEKVKRLAWSALAISAINLVMAVAYLGAVNNFAGSQ